jgi:hypothetical protein
VEQDNANSQFQDVTSNLCRRRRWKWSIYSSPCWIRRTQEEVEQAGANGITWNSQVQLIQEVEVEV